MFNDGPVYSTFISIQSKRGEQCLFPLLFCGEVFKIYIKKLFELLVGYFQISHLKNADYKERNIKRLKIYIYI